MTQSDILSQLKPCPFCGAGETNVRIGRLAPRMDSKPAAIIAVAITHWCTRQPGCVAQHIECRGRDEASAISQWNARAGETP